MVVRILGGVSECGWPGWKRIRLSRDDNVQLVLVLTDYKANYNGGDLLVVVSIVTEGQYDLYCKLMR